MDDRSNGKVLVNRKSDLSFDFLPFLFCARVDCQRRAGSRFEVAAILQNYDGERVKVRAGRSMKQSNSERFMKRT